VKEREREGERETTYDEFANKKYACKKKKGVERRRKNKNNKPKQTNIEPKKNYKSKY